MNKKLVGVVIVVSILAIGGWYFYSTNVQQSPASSETSAPVSKAPVIQNQRLFSATKNENPAYSLPDNPSVTTKDGQTIQLELLFEIPSADKGIYRYSNELYSYDMSAYTLTHLANSDAASFEIVPGGFSFDLYAKDKSNVYCRGEVLAGADSKTFKEIPDWNQNMSKYLTPNNDYIFYEDKDHQYVFGECAPATSEDYR